jgi:hypothetical protein
MGAGEERQHLHHDVWSRRGFAQARHLLAHDVRSANLAVQNSLARHRS